MTLNATAIIALFQNVDSRNFCLKTAAIDKGASRGCFHYDLPFWNLMFNWRVHKKQRQVPILSRMNPVHTRPLDSPKIHFNIIPPSTLRLPSGLFFSNCPMQILYASSNGSVRATFPAYLNLLDFIIVIWWSIQVMKFLIVQRFQLLVSSFFGPVILWSSCSRVSTLCFKLTDRSFTPVLNNGYRPDTSVDSMQE